MDTYDDEIYKYLTESQNYKSAKEISELLANVETRLTKEFWEKIREDLKNEAQPPWTVGKYDDWTIHLVKNDWKDISVCFDRGDLAFGIYRLKDKYVSEEFHSAVKQSAELLQVLHEEHTEWLCWRDIDNADYFRFNSKDKFLRILPTVNSTLIKEFITAFINYAKKVEGVCDKLAQCHINNQNILKNYSHGE